MNGPFKKLTDDFIINIRDIIYDEMPVKIFVSRTRYNSQYYNRFDRINDGWYECDAVAIFNYDEMKWDFIVDEKQLEELRLPMGSEVNGTACVDGDYWDKEINPFNRISGI